MHPRGLFRPEDRPGRGHGLERSNAYSPICLTAPCGGAGVMYEFRLRSATIAIQEGGHGVAMIPAGAESTAGDLPDVRERADRSKLPTNEWEGKMVSIFLLDLMERCERSQ